MRLFRQSRPGEWDDVFDAVARELPRLREDLRDPRHAATRHNEAGKKLRSQGKLVDAARHCLRALCLAPTWPDAHNNLGNALRLQNNLEEAVRHYREALRLKPDFVPTHWNIAAVLASLGRPAEAVAHCREARKLVPKDAEAHCNLAAALVQQGEIEEGLECCEQALKLDPQSVEIHWYRATAWLQLGDFERGWPEYEWRWRRPDFGGGYPVPRPLWDGSPLQGRTILLYAEQGLGDAIQFIRYAPLVKQRGGTVVVVCPGALVRLLKGVGGIDQVIPEGQALPWIDVQAPLLSLPGILRSTLATIPAVVPYLHVEQTLVERWRQIKANAQGTQSLPGAPCEELCVGIAWQGNPQFRFDRLRSIPLSHFARIAQVDQVQLISLQQGPGTDQVPAFTRRHQLLEIGDRLGDESQSLLHLAALIKYLDLVITCDTAVAHLAGALGKPVWVALPFAADWRWLLQREDSPWYPTMRLFRQQRPNDWEEVFERMAHSLRTMLADAANDRGVILAQQGQERQAIEYFMQSVRHRPDSPEVQNNLGNALRSQGRFEEAARHCKEAVRLRPDFPQAHNNLAIILCRQGKNAEALEHYEESLRLRPDYPEAHYNLANALQRLQRFEEAAYHYQQAIRINPTHADAHNNLGSVLHDLDRLPEAVASFHEAARCRPGYADAYYNLANTLYGQGNFDEALANFNEALRLKPDFAEARWNRCLVLLLRGEFERGWPDYEYRWLQPGVERRSFSKPVWNGLPFPGQTLLLHAEQGLGDTIQFIRYLPLVKQLGGQVIVECQEPLCPLLASFEGICQVIAQRSELPPFDLEAPLLNLPAIFQTNLGNIPGPVPYLQADGDLEAKWRRELADIHGFKVGIAWQGNPEFRGDRLRSVPLSQFAPLAAVEGVQLISLQYGAGADQVQALAGQFQVLDLTDKMGEPAAALANSAAIMVNIDLVISCDTAIAHLAGALGVPVWTALPFVPDWRWLLQREDSPWYPSMWLFRQPMRNQWGDVFERMAEALQQ
jgi:tetratricopeptide (TPR) repeat protein